MGCGRRLRVQRLGLHSQAPHRDHVRVHSGARSTGVVLVLESALTMEAQARTDAGACRETRA